MIVFIAEHWVSEDRIAAAEEHIDARSSEQAAQPGFVWRYRAAEPAEPTRIVTVTAWNSASDLEAYRQLIKSDKSFPSFAWDKHVGSVLEVGSEWLPRP